MILNYFVLENLSTFWGLRLFLVAIILFCSWGISYKNRDNRYFWYYAVIIIVFYTLIQGLRYGRGADYLHYAEELHHDIFAGNEITREFLYDTFVIFVRETRIPFYYAFMLYSALLITGLMCVVKKLPKYAIWIVPIFYFLTLNASENFIRQFIALSFLYYAYYYYLCDRRKMMYAMLVTIVLIHSSGLFAVAAFLMCVYIDFTKYLKSPIILLAFFVAFSAAWNIANLDDFAASLQTVDAFEDTNYAGYVENSERWFTEEGDIDAAKGEAGSSALLDLNNFVCNCVIIWFGYYVCRRDRRFAIAYYCSYLAMIINIIGGNIELIGRLRWWLLPLEPIIIGGMLVPEDGKYRIKDYILIALFIATYHLRFLMQVGKPGDFGCAFVWDIVW